MNTVDLSKHLMIQDDALEPSSICPWLLWKHHLVWLEYCALPEPDEMVLNDQPPIPSEQQQEDYHKLAKMEVVFEGKIHIARQAVCERIRGGMIGIVKLDQGCLWTVLRIKL